MDPSTIATRTMDEFGQKWENLQIRLELVPGKEVLAELRQSLSESYGVSLTDTRIVGSFRKEEVPPDLSDFLVALDRFRVADVPLRGASA